MRKLAGILLATALTLGVGCMTADRYRELDSQTGSNPDKLHHAPGGGFRNPPGSPERNASAGDMFAFIMKMIFSVSDPEVPEGHVLAKDERNKQLANADSTSVTWLGHAAFIVRMNGKIILTDPFLGQTAGPWGIGPSRFVNSALTVDQLPVADVMVISHNHYDHLDSTTIGAYPHKDKTVVIVPLGLGEFFTSRGFSQVLERDWWEKWEHDGLEIQVLPAVHFSGRGIGDRNDTLWASFGIKTGEQSLWFSGDTARGEIFKDVGRRAGPFDYALVAIGAFEPRKIMESVHVNPEEAVQLLKDIGARKAIGMHWGTIMLTPENPFDAPTRFRQAAHDQNYGERNVSTMRIGETRKLQM